MKKHKRILLKLSGEQLAGQFDSGIDPEVASYLAEEIKKAIADGIEIAIVAGGGNMVRGAEVAKHGIRRVTGDQMGMLSGLINSMALTDIFEKHGVVTRCLSNIFAPQVAESYSYRLAEKHLEKGRVVIVAAGIGRPYFTHDTAAVNLALELGCSPVFKATKFDGVYDHDPAQHPNATRFDSLSFQEALQNADISVMDKAAMGLAMDHQIPLVIFDAMQPDNLLKAARGESIGTRIG